MKTLISCLLIGLLSFGMLVNEASAKRFGGGRSFGVQRSYNSMFNSSKKAPNSAFNQTNNRSSKWGGLLGGLLIGGLLTSLFMGHGLGSGILSWLIIGGVLFFIISLLRNRFQPGTQSRSYQNNASIQNPLNNFKQAFNSSSLNSFGSTETDYPSDFSTDQFLREAKIKFTRLQAAYDDKNLQDLQDFTAPEVFAEIKMQLDERGNAYNKTEIINLEAELLDLSKQTNTFIASVRFSGSVREDNGPVSQLNEIWHFRQFSNSNEWVVGGIQQNDN